MSDIFISYASDDRERIMPLVRALENTGWSVFWDRTIPISKTWREVIRAELESFRSMIVVWSKISIERDWVLEEAEEGKKKRVLFPVQIDDVVQPLGFRGIQAANLVDWDGKPDTTEFRRLIVGLTKLLGDSPAMVNEAAKRKAEEERKKKEEESKRKATEDARKAAEEERKRAKEELRKSEEVRKVESEREIEREVKLKKLIQEKSVNNALMIVGYVLAVFGSLPGIIIGFMMWQNKATINGVAYYTYNKESRRHGRLIFIISCVCLLIWSIIYYILQSAY